MTKLPSKQPSLTQLLNSNQDYDTSQVDHNQEVRVVVKNMVAVESNSEADESGDALSVGDEIECSRVEDSDTAKHTSQLSQTHESGRQPAASSQNEGGGGDP